MGTGRSEASSSACGNAPPHPNGRRVPALAVHSRCSSPINFAPISCCLLGRYFFVAISFLVTQRTVGFLHPPHSDEFPAGVLSWDNLFGSKSICFSKQTGFPPQTQCHGKEGLFPRCAELAPPSSKTDKARSTSGGVSWAIRRSMSKSGCSLSIFLPPRYCSLRREQFAFYERSQVLERLNIQHDCGQDKSNLVYLQELKEEMETPDFVGGKEGPCTVQLTRVVLLPGVHAATSDAVGPLCGPVTWGQVAGSSL